jgi:hypothetical protein
MGSVTSLPPALSGFHTILMRTMRPAVGLDVESHPRESGKRVSAQYRICGIVLSTAVRQADSPVQFARRVSSTLFPAIVNAGTDRPRILFANEPRLYREMLAAAVAELRPAIDVLVVSPDALDTHGDLATAALVVCSRRPPGVDGRIVSFIELYPDGASMARGKVCGQPIELADPKLDELLALVDAATSARPDHDLLDQC